MQRYAIFLFDSFTDENPGNVQLLKVQSENAKSFSISLAKLYGIYFEFNVETDMKLLLCNYFNCKAALKRGEAGLNNIEQTQKFIELVDNNWEYLFDH